MAGGARLVEFSGGNLLLPAGQVERRAVSVNRWVRRAVQMKNLTDDQCAAIRYNLKTLGFGDNDGSMD